MVHGTIALFAWLISHQTAVLFSQKKPTTSNQPAVLFSQNKPAPAISQPNTLHDGCADPCSVLRSTEQAMRSFELQRHFIWIETLVWSTSHV
jgi:hypothetical protein